MAKYGKNLPIWSHCAEVKQLREALKVSKSEARAFRCRKLHNLQFPAEIL